MKVGISTLETCSSHRYFIILQITHNRPEMQCPQVHLAISADTAMALKRCTEIERQCLTGWMEGEVLT